MRGKWRNWLAGLILVVGPSLEILGSEPSRVVLWHQTTFLGVRTLGAYVTTP